MLTGKLLQHLTVSTVNKQNNDTEWILCSVEKQKSHFAISVLDRNLMVFMVVFPQVIVNFWFSWWLVPLMMIKNWFSWWQFVR
jgi:hypothetical protein